MSHQLENYFLHYHWDVCHSWYVFSTLFKSESMALWLLCIIVNCSCAVTCLILGD